ncbi:MAG: diaminopimelate epimerase [Clostridia bacterium]|jgi:diaminopimelate epimerase|nr:diaminopimelate epimerase [Clostridia bacterium]MCI2015527.1 diaminopimelate epimerase [Clostridia bacterium]
MKFTKMQGCGNDYVYINCFEEKVENPNKLAVEMSERHFGVGSDGLILICPTDEADFRMRMFNSDGSESEMCGNGIRCVGKYVYDKGLTSKTNVSIITLAGIKYLNLNIGQDGKVDTATVDMGEPILKAEDIPVKSDKYPVIDEEIQILDKTFKFTCVSMGNPHAVTYVDNVSDFDVEKYGKVAEVDTHFPSKVNAEFVEKVSDDFLKMRVWERGAGETLACGTGTCATVVASVLKGLCKRTTTVQLLGGNLTIEWRESNNHVYMTGPARYSFEGEWLR